RGRTDSRARAGCTPRAARARSVAQRDRASRRTHMEAQGGGGSGSQETEVEAGRDEQLTREQRAAGKMVEPHRAIVETLDLKRIGRDQVVVVGPIRAS